MNMSTPAHKGQVGEPGHAGHFAHTRHDHDESVTLSLGAQPGRVDLAPLTREVDVAWYDQELPSKRHRKTVAVEKRGTVTVSIRRIAVEDAPAAFSRPLGPESDAAVINYRVVDGQLYSDADDRRGEPWSAVNDLIDDWANQSQADQWHHKTESEVKASIEERAERVVVIDDKTWGKAKEPVYGITTFGPGGGGTSIFIETAPTTQHEAADPSYFPADQYDEAVAYAVETATRRGDTQSLGRLQAAPRIEVTGAFQPGTTWNPAPRFEFQYAWENHARGFAASFAQLRNGIASVPGAVVVEPDGNGGTQRRVDWTTVTAEHKSAYKSYLDRAAEEGILL
ncbi:hypothetical protein [Curtobacterium sp. MCBD17_040]|uniref:hypothetical protein n=1 Tax=Curtobacterium sp. MCBD17_040 TaxID=2175674 RepID=UPI0011B40A8D|nr:hypothetical protein [Curtobacterium sp. MCBD17_040]WIB65434.1 hypothetical protein DEI94_18685 [Curtobacterium sp. MCBD17_040]